MAHSLILGMTESGKTTLGTRLSQHYYGANYGVIVLDPMCDPRWRPVPRTPRDHVEDRLSKRFFQTSDPEEFLKVFWDSRSCMVFIDESGDTVGRYDLAMQQTATKGRHWGHSVFFLSQRGAQISRTVRDQCSFLFLFTTSKEDSKIHANEWNRPQLIEASTLQQGEYFHTGRYEELKRGRLF